MPRARRSQTVDWERVRVKVIAYTVASTSRSTMALPDELFQQTLFDQVLHYGLLIGAVFQLIAIAAIVVLPAKEEEEEEGAEGDAGKRKQEGGDSGGSGEETVARGQSTGGGGSSKKGGKKARKRR